MNKYVAGSEKERLIRIFLLHQLLVRSIDEYVEFDTNKKFVGNLKRSKYFLKSALDQRLECLDKDAEINFIKSINKVGFAFLPKAEAKRELQRDRESKDMYHIHKNDMHDLLGEAIEPTCKVCQRVDFLDCTVRRILMKYEIPDNPGAQGCQYSYMEAGEV